MTLQLRSAMAAAGAATASRCAMAGVVALAGLTAARTQANPPAGLEQKLGAPAEVSVFAGRLTPMQAALADIEGKAAIADERSRFVGGAPAAVRAFPFAIAVFTSANGRDGIMCGGSLIAMNWALTAAHCVTRPDDGDKAYAAEQINVFAAGTLFGDGERVRAKRVVVHPQYTSLGQIAHDIALIEFERPAQHTLGAEPVTLASGSGESAPGTAMKLVGWGRAGESAGGPKSMIEFNVHVVDRKTCNQAMVEYRALSALDVFRSAQRQLHLSSESVIALMQSAVRAAPPAVTEQALCAGDKDVCQNGSGGPLVLSLDGRYVQVGIASWSEGCAHPELPSIYTRVGLYADWIKQSVTGN